MKSSSLVILFQACIGMIFRKHHIITKAFSPSLLKQHRTHHNNFVFLQATIYYPDESSEDGSAAATFMKQEFYTNNFDVSKELSFSSHYLADLLSQDPDNASTLARIASAFSPPGYTVDLTSINDVRCLHVDNTHLEIEAVVCDNYECSSLLIPVNFPYECNLENGLEECVMKNVEDLEKQGNELIQEREHVFADEKEAQKAFDVFKLVSGSDYIQSNPTALPEWWVPPTSSDDIAECDMIEKLLNEADWQLEMRGLCQQLLQESSSGRPDNEVQFARVKAIGPAGMTLEATVLLGGKSIDDFGGVNNVAVVDVPVMFPGDGDATNIREHVLNIVSSVNVH
jgi:hypothetical protein